MLEFFDCELCSRSPKHSFVVLVKPLGKKLQICIFLVSRIKLDYTASYFIILDLIGSNWIKLDQIKKNMFKKEHVLKEKDHIGPNQIKF